MKLILASQSVVRKQILDKYQIDNEVVVSNVDEDEIKKALLAEGANPNTGNIASSCAGGNCKYNFSSGTYTVLNTGKTYKAGVPPSQRKPVSP